MKSHSIDPSKTYIKNYTFHFCKVFEKIFPLVAVLCHQFYFLLDLF